MQIYSNITSTPATKQNFNGYQICRLPEDLRAIVVKNDSFRTLSENCDVYVNATAKKMKWSDPLKFRTPKRNEKAALECVVRNKESGECISKFDATSNGSIYGTLEALVDNMLKKIENIDTEERMNRLMMRGL